ncbi:MAG: glycosyltransferase [Lentisphaerae bacterium]|nr:glycosyltransferase [Lentisphaerota bacterium]
MRISVITPSYNTGRFIGQALDSIRAQRGAEGLEIESIVIDGGSTDGTLEQLARRRAELAHLVVEPDRGPAAAINKGLRLATGDVLAWLNADDVYHPGALARVAAAFARQPARALCFGRCRIVDEEGREIRRGITRFKEACHPFSSRPWIQTINYVSQPAMFFTRRAWRQAGPLREDCRAAFDYELLLRLWRQGGAIRLSGAPLADFRWHPGSISGRAFEVQFREEWEAAAADAGRWSPQALAHACVRWGIVACYRHLARRRRPPPGRHA